MPSSATLFMNGGAKLKIARAISLIKLGVLVTVGTAVEANRLAKKGIFVHPTAIVEDGAEIGDGTKIWHHAHVRRGAKLGKNCVLGKGVYIGERVKIGDNVKIENYVSVFKGVTVDDNVLIGPHVTFTNDPYPRIERFEKWKVEKTVVMRGASIGAGSVILCDITLGRYCMVGAGSTVTKSVPDHALVYGNPARMHGYVCFCGEILDDLQEKAHFLVAICDKCGKKVEIKRKSSRQNF